MGRKFAKRGDGESEIKIIRRAPLLPRFGGEHPAAEKEALHTRCDF
jgi:hypothetical protein